MVSAEHGRFVMTNQLGEIGVLISGCVPQRLNLGNPFGHVNRSDHPRSIAKPKPPRPQRHEGVLDIGYIDIDVGNCVGALMNEVRFRGGLAELPLWLRQEKRCGQEDRKSTRLNYSHPSISYAVFCLKKKKKIKNEEYANRHRHNIAHTPDALIFTLFLTLMP